MYKLAARVGERLERLSPLLVRQWAPVLKAACATWIFPFCVAYYALPAPEAQQQQPQPGGEPTAGAAVFEAKLRAPLPCLGLYLAMGAVLLHISLAKLRDAGVPPGGWSAVLAGALFLAVAAAADHAIMLPMCALHRGGVAPDAAATYAREQLPAYAAIVPLAWLCARRLGPARAAAAPAAAEAAAGRPAAAKRPPGGSAKKRK